MDLQDKATKSPQVVQSDTMTGLYKGIVVDVEDPTQMGKARVHVYAFNGDYVDLDLENLPWAELKSAVRGGITPPEKWDQVWIQFENGDRACPVIDGYWHATPMGDGNLPFSKRQGCNIRSEYYGSQDCYPEAMILGSSGEGNTIWFENRLLDDNVLFSAITTADTSGKIIRARSIHMDKSDYVKEHELKKDLDGESEDENKAVRTGFESTDDLVAFGNVEMGFKGLVRTMHTGEESYTIDSMVQAKKGDDEDEIGIDEMFVGGEMYSMAMESASIDMVMDGLFLSGVNVFAQGLLMLPNRWDT